MVFQKLIVTTNPVTKGPATALIEVGGKEDDIAITTLDGEYHTVEEFEAELKVTINNEEINIQGIKSGLDEINRKFYWFENALDEILKGSTVTPYEMFRIPDKVASTTDSDRTSFIIWNFFPMTLPDTHSLIEALTEAVAATEEGCA